MRPAPGNPAATKPKPPRPIETIYRGRQVAGLLIIGGLLVTFALARANWHEVFPAGWWHIW